MGVIAKIPGKTQWFSCVNGRALLRSTFVAAQGRMLYMYNNASECVGISYGDGEYISSDPRVSDAVLIANYLRQAALCRIKAGRLQRGDKEYQRLIADACQYIRNARDLRLHLASL